MQAHDPSNQGATNAHNASPVAAGHRTMRAKMRIVSVTPYQNEGETKPHQVNLTMSAVCKKEAYDATGADEDNTYAKYTPNASLSISILNPALVDAFAVDDVFYVDFTRVSA